MADCWHRSGQPKLVGDAGDERPTKRLKGASNEAPQAVVLDIEGTVAPISFVHEVMFPYAKKHLKAYLEKHWVSQELQAELHQLQAAVSFDDRSVPFAPGLETDLCCCRCTQARHAVHDVLQYQTTSHL